MWPIKKCASILLTSIIYSVLQLIVCNFLKVIFVYTRREAMHSFQGSLCPCCLAKPFLYSLTSQKLFIWKG